jgi:hypothetical protein
VANRRPRSETTRRRSAAPSRRARRAARTPGDAGAAGLVLDL